MSFTSRNPQFRERIEDQLTRQNFMHHMNFNLHRIDAGIMEGELEIQPIHFQQDGFVHGGVIATIADIVAGFSAVSLVAADQKVVTGEIKISYFAKGEGDKLRAIGRVVKAGKRLNFCEAEVYDVKNGEEKLIAKATTSMITI
jgi:uncharacterized protein (TIGR00369 family)